MFPPKQPPERLSGGQQRRLALAVQLLRDPQVLLLDEPTAGLDWSVRESLLDLLRQLRNRAGAGGGDPRAQAVRSPQALLLATSARGAGTLLGGGASTIKPAWIPCCRGRPDSPRRGR